MNFNVVNDDEASIGQWHTMVAKHDLINIFMVLRNIMLYPRTSHVLYSIGITSSQIARSQPEMEDISLQNSLENPISHLVRSSSNDI